MPRKTDVEQAVHSLRGKIEECARLATAKLGRPVTPEEALRAALGVTTLDTQGEELSAEHVANELHLPASTVRAAAREYIRTGGKSGLGPFRQYGRFRRYPRQAIEAWKASRTMEVRHG